MTTFEVLEFTEAKDQIKFGQYNEALPILYRLAGSYPQDQEIQDLIKLCLNIQQPRAQPPQPIYIPQPQPYFIQPQPKPFNRNLLFLLPGVGLIGLIISVFLPWITLKFTSSNIEIAMSFNGIKGASGSALFINSIKPADATKFTDHLNGWALIGLVIFMAIVILVDVSNKPNQKSAGMVLFLVSIVTIGFLVYQYFDIQNFTDTGNTNLKASYAISLSNNPGLVEPGYGLIVALISGLYIVVTSIIAFREAST